MHIETTNLLSGEWGHNALPFNGLIDDELNIKKTIEDYVSGKGLEKIFKENGEDYFRKLEREISIKYIDHENVIIALGGGAFLDEQIRKKVLKNSLSIWLNWDAKTLINRIKNSKKRPLAYKLTKCHKLKLN